MSFVSLCKRSFGFVSTVLILMFVFSACQETKINNGSIMVSLKGAKLESFMPADSYMVMAFGTDDASQKEMFGVVSSQFPQQQAQQFGKQFVEELNSSLKAEGYDFSQDIWPIIKDDQRLMISISGEMSKETPPKVLLAIPLTAPDKAVEIFEKEVTKGAFEKQSYKDGNLYVQKAGKSFMTVQGDVLLVASGLDVLQKSLDGAVSGNLLTNVQYQKAIEGSSKGVMYFYLDVAAYMKQFVALSELSGGSTQLQLDPNDLAFIESEFFSIVAEKDGFRIKGNVIPSSKGIEALQRMYKGNEMANNVIGKNVMIYGQGSDLAALIELEAKIFSKMEGFSEFSKNLRSFFVSQGMDVDKDLLAFMDKGYAFAVGKSDGLMPWFGLYMDVSSQTDGAKKFVEFLHVSLESALKQAKSEPGLSEILDHIRYGSNVDELMYRLLVKLGEVPEFKDPAAQKIIAEPVVLLYGVNKLKIGSIVFAPESYVSSADFLSQNELFQQMKGRIHGAEGSLSYINVSLLAEYLDQIVDFGVENGGNTSKEEVAAFDLLMSYVKPVKAVVFGAKVVNDTKIESEGFILIQK